MRLRKSYINNNPDEKVSTQESSQALCPCSALTKYQENKNEHHLPKSPAPGSKLPADLAEEVEIHIQANTRAHLLLICDLPMKKGGKR